MYAFCAYVYVRTYVCTHVCMCVNVYVSYCVVVMYIGVAVLKIVNKILTFAVLHELALHEINKPTG